MFIFTAKQPQMHPFILKKNRKTNCISSFTVDVWPIFQHQFGHEIHSRTLPLFATVCVCVLQVEDYKTLTCIIDTQNHTFFSSFFLFFFSRHSSFSKKGKKWWNNSRSTFNPERLLFERDETASFYFFSCSQEKKDVEKEWKCNKIAL